MPSFDIIFSPPRRLRGLPAALHGGELAVSHAKMRVPPTQSCRAMDMGSHGIGRRYRLSLIIIRRMRAAHGHALLSMPPRRRAQIFRFSFILASAYQLDFTAVMMQAFKRIMTPARNFATSSCSYARPFEATPQRQVKRRMRPYERFRDDESHAFSIRISARRAIASVRAAIADSGLSGDFRLRFLCLLALGDGRVIHRCHVNTRAARPCLAACR